MNKIVQLIKTFFAFILPILGRAALQVSADELTRWAYPDRRKRSTVRPRSYYTDYSTVPKVSTEQRDLSPMHSFHDVLMVAFDVKGVSPEDVHEWLMDQMPEPGIHGDAGEIEFDSWWVANDQRFDRSDCDSAVFCAMGAQNEARKVLAEAGLSSEYFQREDLED